MSAPIPTVRARPVTRFAGKRALSEPWFVRWVLIAIALVFLFGVVALPLIVVWVEAFRDGPAAYFNALITPDTLSAIRLTALTVLVVVPAQTVVGVALAWWVTRYEFRGKSFVITMIDLPFAVSPVVAGMLFVLLLGKNGLFGAFLIEHGIQVIFAAPGVMLATAFVTFPIVAREVIPFFQARGIDEEEAALVLGASGWQMFRKVTLPAAKWAILHGVVLCMTRAMGEFGAVSVVSGHVRGETNTMPLHIEALYGEYHFSAAFAVASLLLAASVLLLVAKRLVGRRLERAIEEQGPDAPAGPVAAGQTRVGEEPAARA